MGIAILPDNNMKSVRAEEKITSYKFYNELVPKVLKVLNNIEVGENFVLGPSETKAIDATAIPLLLSMARWIINSTKTIPQLYIPNFWEKEKLKVNGR